MDILSIAGKLLLSFILGAVFGLEREINEKKTHDKKRAPTAILGLRSFSLITVFGAITGFIYLISIPIALLVGAGFIVLLLIFYYQESKLTQDVGLTTELAALYCFSIGILISLNILPVQIIIAVSVMIILLLSKKDQIKKTIDDIGKNELNAFISYAILAAVIMPFLPNINYSISDFGELGKFLTNIGLPIKKIIDIDIVNPFRTWLVVVLITGVDLISYVLGKIIGERRGWLITSVVGGFVSSTATTQSIAQESKTSHNTNYLLASATLANLVSYIQIAFLIGLINGLFLTSLFKILGLMMIMGLVMVIIFLNSKDKKITSQKKHKVIGKIIDLLAALKFAGLYLIISLISKIALSLFGNTGLLTATGIGAFIGIDAVMINTAQLAGTKVTIELATLAFVIANTVNLIIKSAYGFIMGSRQFGIKFAFSLSLIVVASVVGLIIF